MVCTHSTESIRERAYWVGKRRKQSLWGRCGTMVECLPRRRRMPFSEGSLQSASHRRARPEMGFLNFVSVLLHLFTSSIAVPRILPTPAVVPERPLCARLFSFPTYPMRISFGTFQQFHPPLAPSPPVDPKVYRPTLPQESAVSLSPIPSFLCCSRGTHTSVLGV